MEEGYKNLPDDTMRVAWGEREINANDQFLKIEGHPVMERWETPYMSKLAEVASTNQGTVLEVGLGMAISATAIQSYNPDKHYIIEFNHQVVENCSQFLKDHPSVEILEGDWKVMLDNLPDASLDGVLYDTYPMSKQEQHIHQFEFIGRCLPKMKQGGIMTYCNLTSLGVLFSELKVEGSTCHESCEATWAKIWEETQKPHLLACGWKESEISYDVFYLPQDAIRARGNCEYYSHPSCLVPKLVKE